MAIRFDRGLGERPDAIEGGAGPAGNSAATIPVPAVDAIDLAEPARPAAMAMPLARQDPATSRPASPGRAPTIFLALATGQALAWAALSDSPTATVCAMLGLSGSYVRAMLALRREPRPAGETVRLA